MYYNLKSSTVYKIIAAGHGTKLDPDRLNGDQQLYMASRAGYHEHLLKAKRLDHDAKFMIGWKGRNVHKQTLLDSNHSLDTTTRDVTRAHLHGTAYGDAKGAVSRQEAVSSRYHRLHDEYVQ